MNISERQGTLLSKLNDSSDMLTAKTLAQLLGVSSKTIRNDINQLNQQFASPVIASKSGKGYFLNRSNQQLAELLAFHSTENLQFELLRQIIDQEKNNFYQLADRFYISESTLTRLIKELNNVISEKEAHLCIVRKNNELFIDGTEEEKRQIFNLFLNREIENNQLSLDKYADYFDYCDLKKLSAVIISFHKEEAFFMNDFSTISFILHIAVLIERISIGNYLQKTLAIESDDASLKLASKLALAIENQLQINIPSQELGYITRLYFGKTTDVSTIDEAQFRTVVNQLLETISQVFHIQFSADKKLPDYLLTHLSGLYKRANQKQYLTNPLTEELKNKFPFIYNVSVYAAAFIQKELGITFPDDEIAYIALHFLSASETINHGKKRKILLICPYGIASQRLVENRLKQLSNFSIDFLEARSVFDSYSFIEDKEIHLILTTEQLDLVTDIPIYKFHLFLTDDDLLNIKNLLTVTQTKDSISQKFFKKELFFANQTFDTREEVIHFLSHQLSTLGYCATNYVDKVLEREALSSTSYGNYYAIPHAIQRSAKKNAVAICSLESPINWGGNQVKLVLLLALKEERDNSFEDLFGQLVTILNERSFVKKLARQEDFYSFIELCEQKKRTLAL